MSKFSASAIGYDASAHIRVIPMGEHRTTASKCVIEAIAELGEAMGYFIQREWQIPGTEPYSEKIDLVFFIDEKSNAPAFAIEVDSSDAPASISNPVKIFGKPKEALVKPYFVFQVYLQVTSTGHRGRNIEALLGNHNFQTYDFGNDGRQTFIQNLLSHHRAIHSRIDLYAFGVALHNSQWDGVDRYAMLDFASETMNVGDSELADIARLSLDCDSLREALSRRILRKCGDVSCGDLSFVGNMFSWPLLLGLQAYCNNDKRAKVKNIYDQLQRWQSDSEIIFSPKNSFLGLSQEFDFAIARLAPPVFAVVAMLFSGDTDASNDLCNQLFLRATDGNLNDDWARFALAWCTITSIKIGNKKLAESCLIEIDRRGGLPANAFPMLSGSSFDEDSGAEWKVLLDSSPSRPSPSLDTIAGAIAALPPPGIGLPNLVARLLTDDEFILDMHRTIIPIPI